MEVSGAEDSPGELAPSGFTDREIEYLAENILGRVATSSRSNQPHVVPVAYRFDGRSVFFGGRNIRLSLKFKNLAVNRKVAFVVDDVVSTHPWKARGVEIRGDAEPAEGDGGSVLVRIRPRSVRSWGLED